MENKFKKLESFYICLPLYLLGLFGYILREAQFEMTLIVKEDFIEG